MNPPGLLSFPTLWFMVGIGWCEIGIRIQHGLGASRSGVALTGFGGTLGFGYLGLGSFYTAQG